MMGNLRVRANDLRQLIADKLIQWGTRLLPASAYKNLMIHAFYGVNADIFEAMGDLEKAKEIRQAIAPIRIGGRRADRARKRRR